jgi:hypothetical protein
VVIETTIGIGLVGSIEGLVATHPVVAQAVVHEAGREALVELGAKGIEHIPDGSSSAREVGGALPPNINGLTEAARQQQILAAREWLVNRGRPDIQKRLPSRGQGLGLTF